MKSGQSHFCLPLPGAKWQWLWAPFSWVGEGKRALWCTSLPPSCYDSVESPVKLFFFFTQKAADMLSFKQKKKSSFETASPAVSFYSVSVIFQPLFLLQLLTAAASCSRHDWKKTNCFPSSPDPKNPWRTNSATWLHSGFIQRFNLLKTKLIFQLSVLSANDRKKTIRDRTLMSWRELNLSLTQTVMLSRYCASFGHDAARHWQPDISRRRLFLDTWKGVCVTLPGNLITQFPVFFQVLCNGPGTCVPLCAAGLLLGILGMKKVLIVYVESICRVQTLSLTGRILYPVSDYFFVQWPTLRDKYPKSIFLGRIVWLFFF